MSGSLRTRIDALLEGSGRPLAVPRRAVMAALVAVAVAAIVVGVRLYRLGELPAEWYGDISTVYEYAMSTRLRNFPPSLYILGVGPIYPISVSALLSVLSTNYHSIKLAAVLWSLAGLGALFFLCRRLAGGWFAAVAVLVAGTGSWLLVYSRLGDVEAAVPWFAMASLALAARIVETRPSSVVPAALCGLVTGASLMVYGAAFAVPILITATLLWMYLVMPRPRFAARHLVVYAVALLLSWVPIAVSFSSMEQVAGSHFGTRIVRQNVVGSIARNFATALSVYVIEGDPVSRGNPRALPHIDRVGLALAVLGAIYWLLPSRRRWGVVLVGGFFLMHLPTALAMEGARNAARTVAAAPFLYILVASGAWCVFTRLRRRLGATAGVAVAGVLLAVTIGINLDRYFRLYPPGLPYQNTAVASVITAYAESLPPETGVHLVGSTWISGMPEPKSIRYVLRGNQRFDEEYLENMDCARLAAIERPAVLIWSFEKELPSERLRDCAAGLVPQTHTSATGRPLFHAASVPVGWTPAVSSAAAGASTAADAGRELERADIVLGGKPVEIHFQRLDIGQPADIVDGDVLTLMRGADQNPFRFELHYAEPTRLTGFKLWVGYMPEYQIDVVVRDAAGSETRFEHRDRPDPGQPIIDLPMPGGSIEATSVAFAVTDFRSHPLEGWHFHLFELQQR